MATQTVRSPFAPFFDLNGSLLTGGYVYVGLPNQNPETAPAQVFWDSALTQPAALPLKTINGVVVRDGTPTNPFMSGDYSMTVRDKKGQFIFGVVSFAASGLLSGFAAAGANNDITSLSGLTTPLSPPQGGTQMWYCGSATGTANAIVATPVVPSTGLTLIAGNRVSMLITADSTAAVTLNAGALGIIAVRIASSSGLSALSGGELKTGMLADFEYTGAVWQLLNPNMLNGNMPYAGNNTHTGDENFASLVFSQGPLLAPGGRLSITSNTAIISADVTAQNTIYYVPYLHNMVMLPLAAGGWKTRFLGAQLSQLTTDATKSPAAAGNNTLYDMFLWDDSGTVRCTRGPGWSNSTAGTAARGVGAGTTELQQTNFMYTNKNAITNGPAAGMGAYVGTILTNGTATVDWVAQPAGVAGGGNARLGLWNMYNRKSVAVVSKEGAATWAPFNGTRSANASNNNRITQVVGLPEDAVDIAIDVLANLGNNPSLPYQSGVGINSIAVISGITLSFGGTTSPPGTQDTDIHAKYRGLPILGLTFYQWIEVCTGVSGVINRGGFGGAISGIVQA